MRLVSAVLGFVLRKVGLFAGLLLALFLGLLLVSALVPTLRQAEADRDRLSRVVEDRELLEGDLEELERAYAAGQSTAVASLRAEVEAEVEAGRRKVSAQAADLRRQRDERDDVCSLLKRLPEIVLPGPDPCEVAQQAVEKADQALDTFEENLGRAEGEAAVLGDPDLTPGEKLARLGEDGGASDVVREIDDTRADLAQTKAEETSLRTVQDSWAGRVVDLWARSWRWLCGIALVVLVVPPLLRTVSYFVLMPTLSRARRIHLARGPQDPSATIHAGVAERTLRIELAAGEVLSARSEHVRPVQGKVRSRVIYDWSSPFISFAAGLYGLSRVTGGDGGTAATLATPDDPDAYLMRIDFEDHPGVVMHPRHVVGVLGAPELRTRWRWSIQSLATWQVRYILFAGTGGLVVQGSGDVVAENPGGGSTKMDQNLVMGFDSRLAVGISRTEVFLPYLWRRTPLVDDEFTGPHPLFWQKSTADGPSNPVAKTFDVVFSALGKLFGF